MGAACPGSSAYSTTSSTSQRARLPTQIRRIIGARIVRVAVQLAERGAERRRELRPTTQNGETGKPIGVRVHELAVLPLAHAAQKIAAKLRAFLPITAVKSQKYRLRLIPAPRGSTILHMHKLAVLPAGTLPAPKIAAFVREFRRNRARLLRQLRRVPRGRPRALRPALPLPRFSQFPRGVIGRAGREPRTAGRRAF